MLKKEIKAAIQCFDYVLKPQLKKRPIPAKDSPFYSMPKPVVETPVKAPLVVGDSLNGIVDTAGIARVNAICEPEVKAIVIKKAIDMARVRNVGVNATHPGVVLGYAEIHGLILSVRNARREPKERPRKSPQGRYLVFHRYTDDEMKRVAAIKQEQRDTFEKKLKDLHEIYSKQSQHKKSSESAIFFGRRGFEIRGTVDGLEGVAVRYTRLAVYHVDTPKGKSVIRAGTVREETDLKPKCNKYTIRWVETPITVMREKYTGKLVAPNNRAEYHGFQWYDDYKFGAADVGEYYQGY